MGGCCCRMPDDDDDRKVDEKRAVKDDLVKSGTYGTNNGTEGSPVMKERSVSFEDEIGQNAIGSPPEEASEAVPLLNGTEAVPVEDEPKDMSAGADVSETVITTTEPKDEVSAGTSEPRDRPMSLASATSESSTGDLLASPSGDFVFTGPTTSENKTDKTDKKNKKKSGKKQKEKKSIFGRKKRSSSSASAGAESVTPSETSSAMSSQIA